MFADVRVTSDKRNVRPPFSDFAVVRSCQSGELLISTENAETGGVRVAVRDCGPGLAPATLERLFDAFCTTKPQGLGLAEMYGPRRSGAPIKRIVTGTQNYQDLWRNSALAAPLPRRASR
jgi:hypothetical protein